MKKLMLVCMLIVSVFLVGCGQAAAPADTTQEQPTNEAPAVSEAKTLTFGGVFPLTGDGAVYGLPLQKVVDKAIADVNAEWAAQGKDTTLVIEWEDGKCNGKDGLGALQTLANLKGMKVVLGGLCSGETLGAAPFAEENSIVMLSPASTSPEVTSAGDYVFRNIGSDAFQVVVAAQNMQKLGLSKAAILSENTDYAQDMRAKFIEAFEGEVVADEKINSEEKDLRTQLLKIKSAQPDVVFFIPQTIPMAGVFAKQAFEADVGGVWFGSDVMSLGDVLTDFGEYVEGMYVQQAAYETEGNTAYQELKSATECDLGFYCAASYDGVLLLAELLDKCGDQDADCVKSGLYATQGWQGKLQGEISFDENGDIPVAYAAKRIQAGELVDVQLE